MSLAYEPLPILDFIPALTPRWEKPEHLAELAELFERARTEPVEAFATCPPQHGKPLHEETPVQMADGSRRPIKALVPGDRVVSGFGRIVAVTAAYDQGLLDVLQIELRSGRTLTAEATHRFLTRRGWVRAGELVPYRKTRSGHGGGADYLQLGANYDTRPEDGVTDEEAAFLGYMAGDGNATQANCRWTNVDPAVRDRFAEVVWALGGEVSRHDEQTLGVLSGIGALRVAGVNARGAARSYPKHHLKALLEEHGLDGKTAQKAVPPALWRSKASAVRRFLAAYFECDGERAGRCSKTGRPAAGTSFGSVSKDLLAGCQSLLARLGIRTKLAQKRGRYRGQAHLSWRLTVVDDVRLFATLPIVGAKAGASDRVRHADEGDGARTMRDQVVAVRPAGRARCVCITVSEDESFLANDAVTHNTEIVKHAIVQRLLDDPTTRIGYGSYTSKRANKISREIRSLYVRAGGKVEHGASSVGDWRTGHETGGVWAAGVDGSWTGEGFNLAVLDDPIKGRKEAESPVERENLWNWKINDLDTRMHPGSSTLVVHTRWHVDDLGGRLIADGYEHHRMPAISDDGRALWPSHYPLEVLLKRKKRMGEYAWESLYMGRPFARGGRVFDTSTEWIREHSYVVRPAKLRIALGGDFAYSKKTSADWSVLVVLGVDDITERIYVLDVIRRQVSAPTFAGLIKAEQSKYTGIDMRWYYAGAELGIADFVSTLDVALDAIAAAADKLIRAQPVAASWAAGNVFVPKQAEWLDDFLGELGAFTGVNDLNDDQVDAFAAAFDSASLPGWVEAMGKARLRGGGFFR